jgi:hypothetical protein
MERVFGASAVGTTVWAVRTKSTATGRVARVDQVVQAERLGAALLRVGRRWPHARMGSAGGIDDDRYCDHG